MGDPAGIGPELCLRILSHERVHQICTPVVFGEADILTRVAGQCGLKTFPEVVSLEQWKQKAPPEACVVDCAEIDAASVRPGKVDQRCGAASASYFETAVKETLAGRIRGVVTNPVNKRSWHLAGVRFPGHTEMAAFLTGTQDFCMMLVSRDLKVSLVTSHIGLAEVADNLSKERILKVIELTAEAVSRFEGRAGTIGVCGLNPHAGEQGLMGSREEEEIIEPAIQAARKNGIGVEGPLSPDSAFVPSIRSRYQAIVCMYHDQGLIPFKMTAFAVGVNLTLGLPIVRTSVGHGTAYDIAWQGKAHPDSLIEAIRWGAKLSSGEPRRESK